MKRRLVAYLRIGAFFGVAIPCNSASPGIAQSEAPAHGYVPNMRPTPATPPGAQSSTLAPSPKSSDTGSTDTYPSAVDERLKAVKDCISFWDPSTHMSKAEWRKACMRTRDGQKF
jgi:hypothetical protein